MRVEIGNSKLAIGARKAAWLLAVALAALVSGCASPEFKGTPYYTDDAAFDHGSPDDRVPLWPVVYYKNPALSILWPFIEKTDDYFAFRPFVSASDLSKENQTYSVFWPFAQFNQSDNENRIFPVFWGKDYLAAFPFYWHFGHPSETDGGSDTFVPLWSFSKDAGGYSANILWPILRLKNQRGEKGWHVWPLVGHYWGSGGSYSFAFWPFGHAWSNPAGSERGNTILPVYWHQSDLSKSLLLTIPYSRKSASDGSGWQLAPPLFFSSARGDESKFLSPLFCRGGDISEDRAWNLVFPLFYASRRGDDRFMATLLGGYKANSNGVSWLAPALLSGGGATADSNELWLGGPLAHYRRDRNASAQHVFPFYYRSSDAQGSLFLSLPWSSGGGASGSWQLAPPLFFHASGEAFVSPLAARWRDENRKQWTALPPLFTLIGSDGKTTELWSLGGLARVSWGEQPGSQYLLPLVYFDRRAGTFISPVAAKWTTDEKTTRYVFPPALSWLTKAENRADLWMVGPLAHMSWGRDAGAGHVFPLFYNNGAAGTFISPLVATWDEFGSRKWLCPPALSMYSNDGKNKELYAGLGLFRQEWGGERNNGHLIPLYMYGKDYFLTPLAGWNSDASAGFYYPFTPLLGFKTGDARSGSWLFPFYSHERDKRTGDTRGRLLWGEYWNRGDRHESGIFPIYGYKSCIPSDPSQSRFTEFWSLPACWRKSRIAAQPRSVAGTNGAERATFAASSKSHGFFPLWSYKSESSSDGELSKDFWTLWPLYDYRCRNKPSRADKVEEYTRARILWRLWHYERSNGDVAMDIFPAIAYDKKKDGFKRISFLWRFFRYEKGKDGVKFDLLFLPAMRTKGKTGEPRTD